VLIFTSSFFTFIRLSMREGVWMCVGVSVDVGVGVGVGVCGCVWGCVDGWV